MSAQQFATKLDLLLNPLVPKHRKRGGNHLFCNKIYQISHTNYFSIKMISIKYTESIDKESIYKLWEELFYKTVNSYLTLNIIFTYNITRGTKTTLK